MHYDHMIINDLITFANFVKQISYLEIVHSDSRKFEINGKQKSFHENFTIDFFLFLLQVFFIYLEN